MKPSETVSGSAERQLFFQALEKRAGKERAAFLDVACANDPDFAGALRLCCKSSKPSARSSMNPPSQPPTRSIAWLLPGPPSRRFQREP